MKNFKKSFLIIALFFTLTAPAMSEINAYRYDSSLLAEPIVESVVVSPLRHR